MEGEILENGDGRSNRDYILRFKGDNDAKPICISHLDEYITHPDLLVKISGDNDKLFTD